MFTAMKYLRSQLNPECNVQLQQIHVGSCYKYIFLSVEITFFFIYVGLYDETLYSQMDFNRDEFKICCFYVLI